MKVIQCKKEKKQEKKQEQQKKKKKEQDDWVLDEIVFIESLFTIPNEDIEYKLHLQSLWLLHLEVDHAKMIDCKLTMPYVMDCIAKSFKTNLFVI
ncbi:hypothetical protein AZE42_08443 [Rhizopogon vesiculosus]|uniref:RNA polymerase Rpb1 domain-containing protein n=1 Tax=Rhizopogon vesiculosus TaxID=180088 RepID=A0A1J8Q1Z0_9AGAM|nr:hypothetical protein AZE42_08443 [Rhizopogon vesiculosus]